MVDRKTVACIYGPGTHTDTEYTPLPQECRRLLEYLADITPGSTKDPQALSDVKFHGDDLPLIPGPAKSQALAAVLHAMFGIAAKEISALRGADVGSISIDVDQAGLYPGSVSLVSINGKTMKDMSEDGSIHTTGRDLDHGIVSGTHMIYRSWAIYPTKDPAVYYQPIANMNPERYFKAYRLDINDPVKSNEEAYEKIKAVISQYSSRELEQKNMEASLPLQDNLSQEL